MLDIVVDLGQRHRHESRGVVNASISHEVEIEVADLESLNDGTMKAAWNSILTQITDLVRDAQGLVLPVGQSYDTTSSHASGGRLFMPAITPTGVGAGPLPDWPEAAAFKTAEAKDDTLPWTNIFDAGELCEEKVPASILRSHHIILIKRGNCSFSQKLSNIPTVRPKIAFQLVIIVDYESVNQQATSNVFEIGSQPGDFLTRPLLDEPQTTRSGLARQTLVPMVMVGGGEQTYQALRRAKGIGIKRRYSVTSQGIPVTNLMII